MYWYVIITVLVCLPLTIQIICYITIFLKVSFFIEIPQTIWCGFDIFQLTKYERMVSDKLHKHQMNYKKKAAIMMFLITVTFMICRLPFFSIIVYRDRLLKDKRIQANHNVSSHTKRLLFTTQTLINDTTFILLFMYNFTTYTTFLLKYCL